MLWTYLALPFEAVNALLQQSLCRPVGWVDDINANLHAAIARKLRERPHLLGIALQNLRVWRRGADAATRPVLRQWKLILLTWTTEEISDLLTTRTEFAARLRRHSPFCGVLTPEEQRRALAGATAAV